MKLTVAVLAALAASAMEPSLARSLQTFRGQTDLVQLDVSVLDSRGLPVRGLTAKDFTVLEQDAPKPVVAFAAVELPVWTPGAAAWLRDVAPDVATNRRGDQRVVLIVADDCGMQWEPRVAETAREIARATIEHLGPADVAAVVYTGNRRAGQEFTRDRARLRAAVERLTPRGAPPQPDRFTADMPGRGLAMPGRGFGGPPLACQGVHGGSRGLLMNPPGAALLNAGEILEAGPHARKILVLISPGASTVDIDQLDRADDVSRLRPAFAAIQRANVTVYQFDPRGLAVDRSVTDDFGLFAENTGGRTIANTNRPGEHVPRIFQENSAYYLLGIQPSAHDGRFRRLRVIVNRPGVEVRARSGYVAPTDRPPARSGRSLPAADRALAGGLPTGDLPLALTVTPFATPENPGAAVGIIAAVDRERGAPAGEVVQMVARAFDETWKEVARITNEFELPAAGSIDVPTAELGTRLNMRPGRYEIRVAVTTVSDGRTGSVYSSVTVPDFRREPLSLSGIIVERRAGGAAMIDSLTRLLPGRPTTQRIFSRGDRVAVAVRVRQGGGKPPMPVRIAARIVDETDRARYATESTLVPAAFNIRREADYRLDLPIDRLGAGERRLTIEATLPSAAARREVRFSVRPDLPPPAIGK